MSTATLGQLVVQLALDTAKWTSDLGKTVKETNEKFDSMAEHIKGLVESLAVIEAVRKGVEQFQAGIERGDSANNMAQSIGLTTEQLTQFEFAAKRSDIANDQLAVGFKELAKNVALAANGNLDAERKFNLLGVSIYNAQGQIKPAGDLFLDVADKFSTFKDGAIKTADAIEIFGKAGEGLIPMLNEGKSGLEELADRADRLGFTITTNTAQAAAKFSDKLGDVKAVAAGLQTTFAAALEPTVDHFLGQLLEGVTNQEKMSKATHDLNMSVTVLADGFKLAYGALKSFVDFSSTAWAAQILAAEGNFKGAWETIKQGGSDIASDVEDTFSGIADDWGDTMADFGLETDQGWEKVKKTLTDAPNMAPLGDSLSEQWKEILDDLQKKQIEKNLDMADQVNHMKILPDVHATTQEWYHLWNDLDSIAVQGAQGIESDFEQFLENPLQEGFKGLLTSFVKTIDQMVAKALTTQLFSSLFTGTVGEGSSGGLAGKFFGLLTSGTGAVAGARASGGPVSGGSSYLVGENGPELFTPGSSGGISAAGTFGGSNFIHNYWIDAKGADADRVQQMMPSIMEQTRAATKRDIYDAFRRSGLQAPRF